jgi:hypothetical protein
MKPKDSKTLTNSPSTATDDRSRGVQGRSNRVTKEAYDRGHRAGEPSKPRSDDQATHTTKDKHGEKRKTM